jgi:1,4-alpha-glucan branching enzyme
MIHKSYLATNGAPKLRVTFRVPSDLRVSSVCLVGDFNGWSGTSTPFRRDGDGTWTLTMDLECGHAYQFRYLRDGRDWVSDDEADAYVYGRKGSRTCVLIADPLFNPHGFASRAG